MHFRHQLLDEISFEQDRYLNLLKLFTGVKEWYLSSPGLCGSAV